MKTSLRTLFLFLICIFTLHGGLAYSANSPFFSSYTKVSEDKTYTMVAEDDRECVVATFSSQVGIRELTGKNDGAEVEKYLASVGFGKGFAWCGAFVHWTLSQCLTDDHLYSFLPKAKSFAWTPNFSANKAKYGTANPRPGDLFTLYYSSLKRTGHVGFIKQWTNGTKCVTVEGNTNEAGSRSGDGVYVKYRLKSQLETVINVIG